MTSPHDSHTTSDVKPEMIPGVKLEMEFNIINMMYVALPRHAQTEKTPF